ncbi:hypothetical protein CRG98_031109 [Punica granatum]|uniref:Uncharacterized protein n=1 Tax=Punica granatum TaxID=22663 RepID=A0A2I0IWV7_PUNGR|nr:hypothetical protein CRG98_031109 [Punica granatum]
MTWQTTGNAADCGRIDPTPSDFDGFSLCSLRCSFDSSHRRPVPVSSAPLLLLSVSSSSPPPSSPKYHPNSSDGSLLRVRLPSLWADIGASSPVRELLLDFPIGLYLFLLL